MMKVNCAGNFPSRAPHLPCLERSLSTSSSTRAKEDRADRGSDDREAEADAEVEAASEVIEPPPSVLALSSSCTVNLAGKNEDNDT